MFNGLNSIHMDKALKAADYIKKTFGDNNEEINKIQNLLETIAEFYLDMEVSKQGDKDIQSTNVSSPNEKYFYEQIMGVVKRLKQG